MIGLADAFGTARQVLEVTVNALNAATHNATAERTVSRFGMIPGPTAIDHQCDCELYVYGFIGTLFPSTAPFPAPATAVLPCGHPLWGLPLTIATRTCVVTNKPGEAELNVAAEQQLADLVAAVTAVSCWLKEHEEQLPAVVVSAVPVHLSNCMGHDVNVALGMNRCGCPS